MRFPMNSSKSRSQVVSSFTPFLPVKVRGRRINPPLLLGLQFQSPNRSQSCTTQSVICATPRFMGIDTYVNPPTDTRCYSHCSRNAWTALTTIRAGVALRK